MIRWLAGLLVGFSVTGTADVIERVMQLRPEREWTVIEIMGATGLRWNVYPALARLEGAEKITSRFADVDPPRYRLYKAAPQP